MNKPPQKNLRPSDAFLGILVPFFGYFIVYLFELGYFIKLELPVGFIDIDLSKILFAMFILLITISIYLLRFVRGAFPKGTADVILQSTFWLLLSLSVLLFGIRTLYAVAAVLLLLYNSAFRIRSAEISNKRISIKQLPDIFFTSFLILKNKADSLIGGFYSSMIAIAFMMFFGAFLLGAGIAVSEKSYVVLKTSPEVIMIKKYGNSFLCSSFDRKKAELTKNFYLITPEQIATEKLIFKVENIGHLKPKHQ